MTSPHVFHIPQNFIYRGEGNSSIVLSLPESRQILRLHKIKKTKSLIDWLVNWLKNFFNWDYKEEMMKEKKNMRFYSVVMRSLFSKCYVCPADQVYIPRDEIKQLDEFLFHLRPENRRGKRLQHGRATIFEDYTFLPKNLPLRLARNTYSLEIKPKQGWVPLGQEKVSKCTYCLNQYLKLQKGQIKRLSNYCPYDLFSGDELRMNHAIKSLIVNPQNNFRVFRNGICIYDENKSIKIFYEVIQEWFGPEIGLEIVVNKFVEIVKKTLLERFQTENCDRECDVKLKKPKLSNYTKDEKELLNNVSVKCNVDIDENNLPKGCVLREILSVQQLDLYGCHFYSKYGREELDNWSYVDLLVDTVNKSSLKCARCAVIGILKGCEEGGLLFVPYLIAAVARDCSIMLTFQKILDEYNCDTSVESKEIHSVTVGSEKFVASVGILDLYPKPISTIKKHVKRSEDIFKAYRKLQHGKQRVFV